MCGGILSCFGLVVTSAYDLTVSYYYCTDGNFGSFFASSRASSIYFLIYLTMVSYFGLSIKDILVCLLLGQGNGEDMKGYYLLEFSAEIGSSSM